MRATARRAGEREIVELDARRPCAIERMLTDEDIWHFTRAADAAAMADARLAWEHETAGLYVVESPYRHQLREIADLGDRAPGWLYSRWCAAQAYRWMLMERDPRTDAAVRETMAVSHWEFLGDLADVSEFREYGTRIAAGDWICEELCVHEFRGLADFLDVRATDVLLDRCDQVREWVGAPMSGYLLDQAGGDRLIATDLRTDLRLEVLNIGAMRGRAPGAAVLGRVVPIGTGPGAMFASRPVEVDRLTADLAARLTTPEDPTGWLDAIMDGRSSGRLAPYFSCIGGTLFSSDAVAA
jgi:hypothetical protein